MSNVEHPFTEKPGMFNGVFPQKHVAVFYPMATECLTDRLIRKTGFSNVPCISSAILRKEDALETALLQAEIQVLFIVQADELSENDLADVLAPEGRMRGAQPQRVRARWWVYVHDAGAPAHPSRRSSPGITVFSHHKSKG